MDSTHFRCWLVILGAATLFQLDISRITHIKAIFWLSQRSTPGLSSDVFSPRPAFGWCDGARRWCLDLFGASFHVLHVVLSFQRGLERHLRCS